MAEAVADALETGEHLLVQAGTGTGKSLAYLVPVLAHHDRATVATATIALQRQLVDRDLPRLVEALAPLLGRRPTFAMPQGTQQLPLSAPAAVGGAGAGRGGRALHAFAHLQGGSRRPADP